MIDALVFTITGILFLGVGIFLIKSRIKDIELNRPDLKKKEQEKLKKATYIIGNIQIIAGLASFLYGGILFLLFFLQR